MDFQAITKSSPSKKTSRVPAKILMVDDDAALLKTIYQILNREGYLVKMAQTGQEAIELCQKESFDFGIIDLKLPDIEGTKLLEILNKINPHMVQIIMTGYPSLESAVNSLNLGAEEYLIKPFDPDRLLDLIKEQGEKNCGDKCEKLFASVGLSPNEAKVYIALATLGTMEIRKISMASGVPRTKTYAAVKKLLQRGLVSEFPGPMQKYSSNSPTNAFSPIIKNWKKELSDQSKTLVEFEKALKLLETISAEKTSPSQTGVEKETVWTINGAKEIDQRISEMFLEAKSSVRILANEAGLIRFYKVFGKKLDQLSQKNVKIQFNVPTHALNKNLLNDLKYAYTVVDTDETRLPYFMLNADKKTVLLVDAEDDPENIERNETGILAKSEALAFFFRRFFRLKENKNADKPRRKRSATLLNTRLY